MSFNMLKLLRNARFILVVTFLLIQLYSSTVFCSEDYYVDDNRTLLYKIINWWYDCIPKDCNLYCGAAIKCTNQGNTEVEYNEGNRTLTLRIKGGFANLLSALKKSDRYSTSSCLRCTWQNKKYLGSGKADATFDLNEYIINDISKHNALSIAGIRDEILFVIEGNIGGLSEDGTVVLHQSGPFLKNCPGKSDGEDPNSPVSVKVINAQANEVIIEYQANWASME
ncbi:MAG: hypothetical protein V1852_32755 [Pseudomonadota bacterium]